MSDDGRTTNDEKTAPKSKLESMSHEELVTLVKNQVLLKKKLDSRISELTTSNVQLCQAEEEIRNKFEDEQLETKKLRDELNQNKINETKLQQELNKYREASECLQLQNESLKSSCKYFQDELSTVQNDLSNLRSSIGNREEELTNNIATSQNTIENLLNEKHLYEQEKVEMQESMEKLKLELDDLQSKLDTFEREKLQPQPSEIPSERIHSLFNNDDVLTLLSSLGINDYKQEDFSQPIDLESLLRLCSSLIERCKSLQNNESSTVKESVSISEDNGYEQCRLLIHRQEHSGLDAVFEYLYSSINQVNDTNDWQINLIKPNDKNVDQYIRFEVNNIKFISEQVEHDLNHTRSQLHQLLQESEEQRQEISRLKETLHSHEQLEEQLDQERKKISSLEEDLRSFEKVREQFTEQQQKIIGFEDEIRSSEEKLAKQQQEIKNLEQKLQSSEQLEKEHQETSVLEETLRSTERQLAEHQQKIISLEENLRSSEQFKEQLEEERRKTDELQNIINQDKTKLDQLETAYDELQQKCLLLQEIKSEYDLLQEKFNGLDLALKEKQEVNEKLQHEYEHQRLYLLDRDENIHLLKLKLEQQQQSSDEQNDERYLSLSKQIQQYTDLLETKINENKQLNDRVVELENDLKENKQLFFETSKQADDLDKQLQISMNQYEDFKMKFEQINDEKMKLTDKIQSFEQEKSEYIEITNQLKQELENNKSKYDQLMQTTNEKIQSENELQHTIENLQQELESTKINFQNYQTKSTEEKQSTLENEQNQMTNFQKENFELKETNEKQTNEITDLKERQQKMKVLLARLKKELQEKTQQQPKQSLIDLEIADYERTIKTLKEDLTYKDKEIQDLRDDITNLNEKNLSLKQEMENLDQQKLQIEERANKLKTLLDTTKKELHDVKDLEQERHQNEDNVRTLIDRLQVELDDHKITLSQLLAEKQQLIERLNHQSETTQKTISLLEQNLRIANHDRDIAKQDYDSLQDDFNTYKIRAQSVLKQQQQQQSTQRERIPSAVDKQVELEETIEKLKLTLQEAHNRIQLLKSENEVFQREQDRLSEIQAKTISEARKREQELRKQHQLELEKMENECLKRTNDSHDMMKDVTLQNETLSAAFKERISVIETDHERSISILQNQLQSSKQEIEQLKNRIESLRQVNVEHEKETTQVTIVNESNKDDASWAYAERQQGEGSESASGDHQPTDVAVKTLENVLFGNSSNNNRFSSSNTDKPRHVLFEDAELERQRIEEELNKTKYRLLNTTELLNESELNTVRLSEQVALLKEEIRRMERNVERADSISNLEYLKNIILKFFILKSTYERLQLIPVLVTMLKLSPDEQAKLVRVAQQTSSIDNASVNDQSNATSDGNSNTSASSSWGSYLNIW
ncbi:hypothetical protein I4U23_026625 [Adineta vaga]|nr:hypothetical protein I4U23_026625 [Adineta vaga]